MNTWNTMHTICIKRLNSGELLLYSGHEEENVLHTTNREKGKDFYECNNDKASPAMAQKMIRIRWVRSSTNLEMCLGKDVIILIRNLNVILGMGDTRCKDTMSLTSTERKKNGKRMTDRCAFNNIDTSVSIFHHKFIHKAHGFHQNTLRKTRLITSASTKKSYVICKMYK